MKALVLADYDWGIAKKGRPPYHLKEDLQRFKEQTTGGVVVMGRKTLESLPGGKPLKDRTNIVLSRNKDYKVEGAIVLNSIDELKEELKKYDDDSTFIIGGEEIYKALISECSDVIVTWAHSVADCDQFFPNLFDMEEEWIEWGAEVGEPIYDEVEDVHYEYIIFCNRKFYNEEELL